MAEKRTKVQIFYDFCKVLCCSLIVAAISTAIWFTPFDQVMHPSTQWFESIIFIKLLAIVIINFFVVFIFFNKISRFDKVSINTPVFKVELEDKDAGGNKKDES